MRADPAPKDGPTTFLFCPLRNFLQTLTFRRRKAHPVGAKRLNRSRPITVLPSIHQATPLVLVPPVRTMSIE